MSGSVLHKNHNPLLSNFRVIAHFHTKFCVEHSSVTTNDISMKLMVDRP